MANDQTTADLIRENRALTARVAELEAALKLIADTDPVDAALDPQRAIRVAAALLSGGGDG